MTLRFFIGFCSMAVTVVSFVLVIELVSGKYRTIIGIVNIIPVAISYILSAGIHYVAVDWRPMQLYITSPGYVLVFVWYFLPESPRWLLAKGRTAELAVIIRKAARMNQRSLPSNFEKTLTPPEAPSDKRMVSVMDLFQPAFKRTTLLMTVIWFSIILIYFGITLHMSNLGGNIYVNTVSGRNEAFRGAINFEFVPN
jgi:MFS transporter, OCT family, solute carrier family 22 (organic cation transporter), member 4/5